MFKRIRYFQKVVELGSFSAAAEACYLSQSAISQQVQALERELGVQLLTRGNRRFTLTPAGAHFYRESLSLTDALDRLCRETAQIAREKKAVLRLGYLRSYAGGELQQAVSGFAAAYPDVLVEMKGSKHEELYDLLRTGGIDILFSDLRRAFSDVYVSRILAEPCCRVEISVHDPIARLPSVDVADLGRTPCILVAARRQQENERLHYHQLYGIDSEFLFAENLEEARLLAAGGRGFLPVEGGLPSEHFAASLASIPLRRNGRPIRRKYGAFWRVDNAGFYIEEFARILEAAFERE